MNIYDLRSVFWMVSALTHSLVVAIKKSGPAAACGAAAADELLRRFDDRIYNLRSHMPYPPTGHTG